MRPAGAGDGLIPTYAGNTILGCLVTVYSRAHPHVCGEHWDLPGVYEVGAGSSPRMRGTRALVGVRGRYMGLIPTYAGNTGCAEHG